MNLRTTLVVAAAAAATGGLVLAGPTEAATESPADTRAVFHEMCEARGGLPVWTPYALGRCQGARANKGFDPERAFCVGLGDTEFTVTISTRHMNRANWVCTSTVPVR